MDAILQAEIYCLCFIVISILLFWTDRNGIHSYVEMCLSRLLGCFLLYFALGFLFVLFTDILTVEAWLSLSYICKTLQHLTLIMGVFTWTVYAAALIRDSSPVKQRYSFKSFLLTAPVLPPIILPFLNLQTHQLFFIDESANYIRGPWYDWELMYLFIFSAIPAIVLLIQSSRESGAMAKFNLRVSAIFPLSLFAGWALSFMNQLPPALSGIIMLALLLLFMGSMMQQVSIDSLTQVNNRQNLLEFMTQKLKSHNKDLYLLMMDMDDFKSINDNYGHVEGDRALVSASSSIKAACGSFSPRPYIARYGGDEFIVLVETDNLDDITKLTDSIRESLSGYSKNLPYELNMSIGVAKHHDGQAPKELIHEADQLLYDVKERKRS